MMKNLLSKIRGHFDALDRGKNCFSVFARNNVMLEGWFKGELLGLFTQLRLGCECEKNFRHPQGKRARRVDFSITLKGVEHLIELKAIVLPGEGAERPKSLRFFFGRDYIPKDADKLRGLSVSPDYQRGAKKYLLAFIYASPDAEEWETLLAEHKLKSPDNVLIRSANYSIALISIP